MNPNEIDIRGVKTVYINPNSTEKYQQRKAHMDSFLTDIGFTNFQHFQMAADDYQQSLIQATIDVLQANMNDTPLLLLGDDVELISNSSFVFQKNGVNDAIYLGLSRSAGHPTENRNLGNAVIEEYSPPSMVRVLNMLGSHAILYCSQRYKQAVVDILTQFKLTHHNDILFSRIQSSYYIAAPKIPVFYQSSKWNDGRASVEWNTNLSVCEGYPPQLPPA
jgi:hypothetical protein